MVSVVVTAAEEVTVRLAGMKVHVTKVGSVPQAKLTVPVNPPVGVSVITVDAEEPLAMVRVEGFALSVKLGACAEPVETTRLTAEPELTLVPATGLSLMTMPDATVELLAVVTVPTTSPAPVMAVVAADWVSPATLGTATCAGPAETTRLTADPEFTLVPALGLSLMTIPDATVELLAEVTVPTTSPAPVMAVVAADWVSPATLGTATCAGPVETTKLTAEPEFTLVPALGLSLMTIPDATVELLAVVSVPTTSPAPVMAVVAAA
jgi:hypothetical protein